MNAIRSILAATDFTADACHSTERAARLAAMSPDTHMTVLHVVEGYWLHALQKLLKSAETVEGRLVEEATSALQRLTTDLRDRYGVTVESLLRTGKLLDVILEAHAECDLLALGAHGSHPVREIALGTTAQRVLSRTNKPVLVVKRAPDSDYDRVLVAIDFSEHSERALAMARAVAPRASALYAMHAFEVPYEDKMDFAGVAREVIDEYRSKAKEWAEVAMKEFLEATGAEAPNVVPIIEHGHAPARLRERARAIGADLVVVGKHGKSPAEALFIGSVTRHVLAEVPCDVLVV